jgi:TolB-like protein/class 3 adenylate cyclase
MARGGESLRLAAIVFTDIVGYSAVINRNAVLGAKLLDRQRSVVRKCVPMYGGREVETAGDSFLLEFSSALKALECVADIQRRLVQANEPFPETERVSIRASIHLGDVEHRAKEVFGDGVNVAARIMPFSPEGGIAFSETVQQQVRSRIQVSAKSIGSPPLKNIAHPIEVFTLEAAEMAAIQSTTIPEPESAAPAKSRIVWVPVAGLAGCLITAALLFWLQPRRTQVEVVIPEHSIAVLPFTNLSGDPNNAYFSDGMQDEILTALAKIHSLKVISRTSTEQYRGKTLDLHAIAKALGANTVLEGSVQRSGNKARINVQLIEVQTDTHLWAETYDREMTDVFSVQSEIAGAVASALNAQLTASEQAVLATAPTQNAAAYDAYLRGRAYQTRAENTPDNFSNAIRYFEQAVRLDPGFALAWAQLAHVYGLSYWLEYDHTPERLALMTRAAGEAARLQPDLAEAALAQGYVRYFGYQDYEGGLKFFEQARQRLPSDTGVLLAISFIKRRQGKLDEAARLQVEAAKNDPQNTRVLSEYAGTLTFQHARLGEARTVLDRALNLTPDDSTLLGRKISIVQAEGNLVVAAQLLEGRPLRPQDDLFQAQIQQLLYVRRYAPAIAALQSALATSTPQMSTIIGYSFVSLGLAQQRANDSAGAIKTCTAGITALQALRQKGVDAPLLSLNLAQLHACLGHASPAREEASRAEEALKQDRVRGPGTREVHARVEAQLGNADVALALIEALLKTSYYSETYNTPLTPALLRLDPAWDPIRNDPRFQKLAQQP